jgi:7-cyano-7-deazaguanine synthase
MNKEKVVVLFSGGQDSTCMLLECIDKYGAENTLTLGFDYGNRHFAKENEAAEKICKRFNIPRKVLKVPLGDITKGSALTDTSVEMTTSMDEQVKTVVQLRNMMFLTFAASYAAETGCSAVYHGACDEDQKVYRDCRPIFFRLVELAIQSGLTTPTKGSDDVNSDINSAVDDSGFMRWDFKLAEPRRDIRIETPLIKERKEQTLARILKKWPVEIFKDTWTCYNGGLGKYNGKPCGVCCSCQERLAAFMACGVEDPVEYYRDMRR